MKVVLRRLFSPAGWPMAGKLLATFALVAWLPLLVLGLRSYAVARQAVLDAEVRALVSHASNLASRLDLLLTERQRNLRTLAEDAAVTTFSAAWPDASAKARAAAQQDLEKLAHTNPYFSVVRLLNREGLVILSTAGELRVNYSFHPYFQQALAGNEHISDVSVSVDTGQPVIYFGAPVRDRSGQVVAVAVLAVRAEEMWVFVEAEKDMLGAGSLAVLFDEYGLRLAHSSDRSLIFQAVVPLAPDVEAQLLSERRLGTLDRIQASNYPDLAEGIQRAESRPYFTHHLAVGDERYHAGAARMTVKPWTVVETLPESAFLAPVKRLVWTIGLAMAAVALAAFAVTALIGNQIVKPVRELTAAARSVERGELGHALSLPGSQREDEIGVLVRGFEAMRAGLQDSYAALEARNVRLRRLYELAAGLSGDVTQVADRVVSIIAELLDVKMATVEEIHQDRRVVISMLRPGEIVHGGEFPLQGTPCENVRDEKSICYHTQAADEPPASPFLAEHDLTTYLAVPMLDSRGEVLGIVNAMDSRSRDFGEDDIHLLETLAHRMAVEIERRRDEQARQLLQTMTQAISEAEDFTSAMQIALRKVCEATGWAYGEAWLPSSDGTYLQRSPAWYSDLAHLEPFWQASARFTFAPGIGLPGRVWSSRRPAWIPDVTVDPNFPRAALAKEVGIKAGMAIPILAGDDFVAVIEFFVLDPREEDQRLIELVSAVAAQLGVVFQRRQAEEALRLLNEELEQRVAERTAALQVANGELEAFSYSVSHDLRAPLRAIDGFSRILHEDYAQDLAPEAARYLQLVRDNTLKMGQLIDDLLAFSRLNRHELKRQPVDTADLVARVVEELRPEWAGRPVEFRLGELPACQADPALLKQVFMNLVSNAIKFTRQREVAVIEIGSQEEGGKRAYFVRDNGVGFDMQYVHKLFGVFQRLHRAEDYAGTGVGLAIVQRIIHRHGGRVWAEGVVGEGATFRFEI